MLFFLIKLLTNDYVSFYHFLIRGCICLCLCCWYAVVSVAVFAKSAWALRLYQSLSPPVVYGFEGCICVSVVADSKLILREVCFVSVSVGKIIKLIKPRF